MAGRLGRTLLNLILACLNATLILVVLCLWLAWQVTSTVEKVSANVVTSVAEIEPLGGELREISGTLTGIRGDLDAIRSGDGLLEGEALRRIEASLSMIEARVDTAAARIEAVAGEPEVLIGHAIDRIAAEIKTALQEWLGARRPDPASDATK